MEKEQRIVEYITKDPEIVDRDGPTLTSPRVNTERTQVLDLSRDLGKLVEGNCDRDNRAEIGGPEATGLDVVRIVDGYFIGASEIPHEAVGLKQRLPDQILCCPYVSLEVGCGRRVGGSSCLHLENEEMIVEGDKTVALEPFRLRRCIGLEPVVDGSPGGRAIENLSQEIYRGRLGSTLLFFVPNCGVRGVEPHH